MNKTNIANSVLNLVKEVSQNKEYGFYGTSKSNYDLNSSEANTVWDYMLNVLRDIMPTVNELDIEKFMDSNNGRHLADELSFHMGDDITGVSAVKKAIKAWSKKPGIKWVVKAQKEML